MQISSIFIFSSLIFSIKEFLVSSFFESEFSSKSENSIFFFFLKKSVVVLRIIVNIQVLKLDFCLSNLLKLFHILIKVSDTMSGASFLLAMRLA